MSSGHTRIVVAELPSPWRSALVRGLEEAEPAVRVTEYGQELRRALEEVVTPPRVVVIGQTLNGIGGLEALYLADRTLVLEKKRRPEWPARTVSLITEVRSDAELLDLYRRRGANQFIYRDDPIEKTVAALLATLRRATRTMVRLDATFRFGEHRGHAAIYDLSRTGAKLVLAKHQLPELPSVGTVVGLGMSFRDKSLECTAEVRRLAIRPGSVGDRLVLGIQFLSVDESAGAVLEAILREASEEFEMVREE